LTTDDTDDTDDTDADNFIRAIRAIRGLIFRRRGLPRAGISRGRLGASRPMKTHVEFRSDKFPPFEGEEEFINPNCYGKRLAEFIVAGLPLHGFEPEEIISEDWGWVVPIKNEGFDLSIGCGHYEEYSDGFLCFIKPHTPVIKKLFKKIEVRSRVEALQRALDAVLSESAGIRNKKWWTHDEFNHPST